MDIETNHRIFASQHIVIYPSNGKLLWWGVNSLLLLLAGIGIIHLGYLLLIVWTGIPIVAYSILGLLLFLFRFFFQVFAPSPMLIINDKGIQVTRFFMATTMVKWEEISTIDLRKVGTDNWFEVTLSAEGKQSFFSRQSGLVRSRRSSKRGLRVIIISQQLMPLSVKQLIEKIQRQYQMYLEHYHIRIRM
jgi:hypothetical protein